MRMHRKKNTRIYDNQHTNFYAGGLIVDYALCGFSGNKNHRQWMWITKTAPVTCKRCLKIMGEIK